MHINFNYFNPVINSIKNYFLAPLASKNHQVITITAAIFAALGTCFLIKRYYFTAKVNNESKNDAQIDKVTTVAKDSEVVKSEPKNDQKIDPKNDQKDTEIDEISNDKNADDTTTDDTKADDTKTDAKKIKKTIKINKKGPTNKIIKTKTKNKKIKLKFPSKYEVMQFLKNDVRTRDIKYPSIFEDCANQLAYRSYNKAFVISTTGPAINEVKVKNKIPDDKCMEISYKLQDVLKDCAMGKSIRKY